MYSKEHLADEALGRKHKNNVFLRVKPSRRHHWSAATILFTTPPFCRAAQRRMGLSAVNKRDTEKLMSSDGR